MTPKSNRGGAASYYSDDIPVLSHLAGLILRKILDWTGGDIYGERGVGGQRERGLGAEPPTESRGRAPGQGVSGAKPS